MKPCAVCLLLVLSMSLSAAAGPQGPPASKPPVKPVETAPVPSGPPGVIAESPVVTRHTITIGGKPLSYTAACGMMPIRENGKLMAHIFYIAYAKDGVKDREARPILFSFNGGPGSASLWMHLGFTGPRIVVFEEEGWIPKPPFRLADNEHTILDAADIVYIDPVGTGYSRMMPGEDAHKYHGVIEDIQSIGEFVRMYLHRNGRWNSPKYVIGESYGTTRAAGLTGYLADQGIYLDGTILVSTTTLDVLQGEELSYMTILPHYTATAWYHGKLPADLQAKPLREVLDLSEAFAQGEYLNALVKGNRMTAEERASALRNTARFTGLSEAFVRAVNLRVSRTRFQKELLRSENRTVGRLDSRYKGVDKEAAGESPEKDPAMDAWLGPYTIMANRYLKQELGFDTDEVYHVFGSVSPWKSMTRPAGSPSGMPGARPVSGVGEMLRAAMGKNPHLRVLVLEGYYDGACDYFGAVYTFAHLDPEGEFTDRIEFAFYECGHMMYVRKADLAKAGRDLAAFIAGAARR
ncbi:MAG TPA: peptidase S10 [Candidatus Aminicenantes bacterium]|nr:peptidase S10 [Candidatus Aminicenantes bacterium]